MLEIWMQFSLVENLVDQNLVHSSSSTYPRLFEPSRAVTEQEKLGGTWTAR